MTITIIWSRFSGFSRVPVFLGPAMVLVFLGSCQGPTRVPVFWFFQGPTRVPVFWFFQDPTRVSVFRFFQGPTRVSVFRFFQGPARVPVFQFFQGLARVPLGSRFFQGPTRVLVFQFFQGPELRFSGMPFICECSCEESFIFVQRLSIHFLIHCIINFRHQREKKTQSRISTTLEMDFIRPYGFAHDQRSFDPSTLSRRFKQLQL